MTDADEVVEVIPDPAPTPDPIPEPDPTPDPEPDPAPDPGGWPDNEPTGLVPVFPGHPTKPGTLLDGSDLHFDYVSQGGSDLGSGFNFGPKWDGGPRILKATEPGSRYPEVIRKNMLIGDGSGWNGTATIQNFPADYETLYMRLVFKYSANWQFHGSAEKLWLFGEGRGTGSGGGQDFVVGLNGSQQLIFTNQSAAAQDGGQWRSPGTIVTRGEWHTVEMLMIAQSALGVADGAFWIKYNGTEITDFRKGGQDVDPSSQGIAWYRAGTPTRLFSGLQLPMYWGGGPGPIKAVNDHIDVGEFYITGVKAIN